MTRSRDFWVTIPEIDDAVLLIETNDAGGPPVLMLREPKDPQMWVFNWGADRYEPTVRLVVE